MNHRINFVLVALALAITATAQAGPGSKEPKTVRPRSITTREVTASCPRCQQRGHVVEHQPAKPAKHRLAETATAAGDRVM